jgi:hypothetical protein
MWKKMSESEQMKGNGVYNTINVVLPMMMLQIPYCILSACPENHRWVSVLQRYSVVHLVCTHVNFYANKRSNHYFLNKVHGLLLDRLTFINLTWGTN